MQLNVYISSADDGLFTIKAVQIPELTAHAQTIEGIPHAVRCAAGAMTGKQPEDFDVIIDF
ncbi:hypothetical protein [Arthrobacter sp. D3-16]